jgi:hypothetical protein
VDNKEIDDFSNPAHVEVAPHMWRHLINPNHRESFMKLNASLTGAAAAMLFVLAANGANATTAQCSGPDNGLGGTYQQEVGQGDPCETQPSWTPLIATVYTANNEAYTVQAEIENGSDYLLPGEVIEVSMDLDDVMAALKSDEQQAVAVAEELGIRKKSVGTRAAMMAGTWHTKLSDAEYAKVANYVYKSMQSSGGRATGRSDPAGSFTSRVAAVSQAVSRMFDSIGRNLPNFSFGMTTRKYYPNGQVQSETTVEVGVKKD